MFLLLTVNTIHSHQQVHMPSKSPSQFDLEIQQLILDAERVMIEAQSKLEAGGLDSSRLSHQLQRQLSAPGSFSPRNSSAT